MSNDGEQADSLKITLEYLSQLLNARLHQYFKQKEVAIPPLPKFEDNSPFSRTINALELSPAEQVIIVLALVPELDPALLPSNLRAAQSDGIDFSIFGGIGGK
ncbi:MAG: hypothetical protein AAGF89_00795, partial [Bacteroidota bacterium]